MVIGPVEQRCKTRGVTRFSLGCRIRKIGGWSSFDVDCTMLLVDVSIMVKESKKGTNKKKETQKTIGREQENEGGKVTQ